MRAAGVSAWRFILPAAAAAFVRRRAGRGRLDPISADLARRAFELERARLIEDYLPGASPKDVWLREGDGTQPDRHPRQGAATRPGRPC